MHEDPRLKSWGNAPAAYRAERWHGRFSPSRLCGMLIPYITLIVINLITTKELPEFILKGLFLAMLMLIEDIGVPPFISSPLNDTPPIKSSS
jgi:hypothetical protein